MLKVQFMVENYFALDNHKVLTSAPDWKKINKANEGKACRNLEGLSYCNDRKGKV